jgi:hypothetical protein
MTAALFIVEMLQLLVVDVRDVHSAPQLIGAVPHGDRAAQIMQLQRTASQSCINSMFDATFGFS